MITSSSGSRLPLQSHYGRTDVNSGAVAEDDELSAVGGGIFRLNLPQAPPALAFPRTDVYRAVAEEVLSFLPLANSIARISIMRSILPLGSNGQRLVAKSFTRCLTMFFRYSS